MGGLLAPDALDVPLTTADLAACGAALGHAGLVACDQRVTPEEVLRHIWQFAAAEAAAHAHPAAWARAAAWNWRPPATPPGHEWKRLSHVTAEASLCAFGRRIPPAVHSLARAYGGRLAKWNP